MKKLIIALTLFASLLTSCGSDFKPVAPDSGRRGHTAVVIDNKMYVFGGLGDGTFLDELWEYDLTLESWTRKNPPGTKPGPRASAAAVVIGPNMYVLGGYDRTIPVLYNDIWMYSQVLDSWTEIPSATMPAVQGHSAVTDGTYIYVFGGYDGTAYVNTLWRCDPVSGFCSPIPGSGPSARAFHSATIFGSDIYIFGGFGLDASSVLSNLNDLWVYHISTDEWQELPPLDPSPAARSKHSMTSNDAGTLLLVFGGSGSTSNKIWFYDIGANTWTENPEELSPAPASRASHSAVMYNSMMYIYGGYISAGSTVSLNDLWEFEPVVEPNPDIWLQKTSIPTQ